MTVEDPEPASRQSSTGKSVAVPPPLKSLEKSGVELRSNIIVIVSAILSLASVALLVYIIAWQKDSPKLLQIRVGRYTSTGKIEPQPPQITFKIWTPNEHTAADLDIAGAENIPAYYKYTEAQGKRWVNGLKNLEVGGYSYYEVWGIGTNPLKRGLQWEITAPKGGKLTRRELLKLYSEVFKRTSGIYLEEMTLEDRK